MARLRVVRASKKDLKDLKDLRGKSTTPEVAKALGVDYIVKGEVLRDTQTVKVTTQLLEGENDKLLWRDSFQRDLKDLLPLQSDLARTIARVVGAKLTPQGEEAASTRSVSLAAYEASVRGQRALSKGSGPDLHEGIRLFQEAIDADPTYAPAYAGMSDCYALIGYKSIESPEDSFPRAKAAAQKALELDPNLAQGHASLGYAIMYYDWNFPLAEQEYRRAIELNPSYPQAHQFYAYVLMAMGRPEESLRQVAEAERLDPLSSRIRADQAYMLYYDGKTDSALKAVNVALEMDPKSAIAHFWLVRIYTSQGRYREAEAELEKVGPLRTWTPMMASEGFLYGLQGKRKEAEGVIQQFADLQKQGKYVSAYALAAIYVGLKDKDQTFAYLDKAYAERSHWLLWLNNDPRWDSVRSDPRFKALVRKVGLPS